MIRNEPGAGDGGREKVNLREKMECIRELWSPKILAQVNDAYLKLVKVQGEYVWHHHDREDELFLVLRGRMTLQFRDRDVFVFRDTQGKVKVLHRTRDGKMELIEAP